MPSAKDLPHDTSPPRFHAVPSRIAAALAVPLLWSLVLVADRMASPFYYADLIQSLASFVFILCSGQTAFFPLAAKPRRIVRLIACMAFAASLLPDLVLSVLHPGWASLHILSRPVWNILLPLWLIIPFPVLCGDVKALRLLSTSMRIGMLLWLVAFGVVWVDTLLSGYRFDCELPVGALAFLTAGFLWFSAAMLKPLSGTTPVSSHAGPEWSALIRYLSHCGMALCLVMVWIMTGFTNDGGGSYGAAAYNLPYPFYDVAALVEPFSFSNGPFLLLHSVPWREILFSVTDSESLVFILSGLHWHGLSALVIALAGCFMAALSATCPSACRLFAVPVLAISALAAFEIVSVREEFISRPYDPAYCAHPPEAVHTWECGNILLGGGDSFMLTGQYIPALVCCGGAALLAVALLLSGRLSGKRKTGKQYADIRKATAP